MQTFYYLNTCEFLWHLLFLISDKCPGASVEFIGKEGIFVQGTLTPKLKDVMITVKTLATETHKESKTLFAMTDENGFYR